VSEEEKSPSIREALVDFQQALDDYDAALYFLANVWDQVQSSDSYKSWQQTVEAGDPLAVAEAWNKVAEDDVFLGWLQKFTQFNEAKETMLNAKASLGYALAHWRPEAP